jgi:hypothetical protein
MDSIRTGRTQLSQRDLLFCNVTMAKSRHAVLGARSPLLCCRLSLRLALRLSLQESCSQNTTAAAATPVKGKKAAVRIVTPPEKENVPPAAAPRKETIMSSLKIACRLSLQESCAPKTCC